MCKHTWHGSSKRTTRFHAVKSRREIDLRDAKSRYSSISIFRSSSTIFTFPSRIVTFLQIYNQAINIRRAPERERCSLGTWHLHSIFNVESRALMYLNPKQKSQNSHILPNAFSLINLPSKDQISTREKPSVNSFDDFLAV